jgi:uncharacterized membrane protein YeaQ/YmgE (transglycosylase-associated protein family)
MNVLWIILFGCVVGVLARLIAPGRKRPFGFLLTVALGISGAFAGAFLGQEAGWYDADEPTGLLGAVMGAVLVGSGTAPATDREFLETLTRPA